ncbi:ferredoxin [Streptomyces sp. enrichment culture]|uniref:ferredoxin n=1 Tax=Streptomyces sp. enrichment culture TaxID=1795815 RepID=UPI003F57BF29
MIPLFAQRRAQNAAPEPAPAVLSLGPGVTRLTAGLHPRRSQQRLDRSAHLSAHGPLPDLRELRLSDLHALTEQIALRAHGDAAYFHRTLRTVVDASRRRGVPATVVVDTTQGEPPCRKDEMLLRRAPHLVLDGALLAAAVLNAQQVVIGVSHPAAEAAVKAAVTERQPRQRSRRSAVRVVRLPKRFTAAEDGALVRGTGGRPWTPAGRWMRGSDADLDGPAALRSNAETWAQLAVAARTGATRFAAVGEPGEPGTFLATVTANTADSGRLAQTVVEAPLGIPLPALLERCRTDVGQAVLIGGYHGAFLSRRAANTALMSRRGIEAVGATFGAGAVVRLPEQTCPLGETARAAQWLVAETASQCGLCFRRLSAVTAALDEVVHGRDRSAMDRLRGHLAAARGRGTCSHADRPARLVISALSAFTDDLAAHTRGKGCGRPVVGALPLPNRPEATEVADRFAVDWTLCDGHALCADMMPELIQMGQDGYPVLSATDIPPHLTARAKAAVRRCPALALRVEEIPSGR